jgi:hypothetical protein
MESAPDSTYSTQLAQLTQLTLDLLNFTTLPYPSLFLLPPLSKMQLCGRQKLVQRKMVLLSVTPISCRKSQVASHTQLN